MDIDSIPPGADFAEILQNQVSQCEIVLALIGPGWGLRVGDSPRLRDLDYISFRAGPCAPDVEVGQIGRALVEHKISASSPKPDICDAHRRSPEDPAQRRVPPGWKFAHQSSPGRPRSRLLLIARDLLAAD